MILLLKLTFLIDLQQRLAFFASLLLQKSELCEGYVIVCSVTEGITQWILLKNYGMEISLRKRIAIETLIKDTEETK